MGWGRFYCTTYYTMLYSTILHYLLHHILAQPGWRGPKCTSASSASCRTKPGSAEGSGSTSRSTAAPRGKEVTEHGYYINYNIHIIQKCLAVLRE